MCTYVCVENGMAQEHGPVLNGLKQQAIQNTMFLVYKGLNLRSEQLVSYIALPLVPADMAVKEEQTVKTCTTL